MIETWASELDLGHVDWPLSILLFLDFDGVLHPELFHASEFCYLPMLENLLRRHPNVGIVITSSWREERDFERLRRPFSADIRARVLACSPTLSEGRADEGRWLEIRQFFTHNALDGMPFLIIDDEARLFPEGLKELYLTDSSGLTEIDIRLLDRRLTALMEG